jgi:hypothetical protein
LWIRWWHAIIHPFRLCFFLIILLFCSFYPECGTSPHTFF